MDASEALLAAARTASTRGDYQTLQRVALELISWAQVNESTHSLAEGYRYLGGAMLYMQDARAAELAYHQALDIFEEIGDRHGAANVTISLVALAMDLNLDVVEARRLIDQALPLMREMNDPLRLAVALGNAAEVSRQEGAYDDAIAYAKESLEIFQSIGETARAAAQLTMVAHCFALKRDYAGAFRYMTAAYEAFCLDPNPKFLTVYFDVWFILAARLRQWELAAQLFGFMEEYRDVHRVPRLRGLFSWFAPSIEAVTLHLGDERLSQLRAKGSALSWADAHQLATTLTASAL